MLAWSGPQPWVHFPAGRVTGNKATTRRWCRPCLGQRRVPAPAGLQLGRRGFCPAASLWYPYAHFISESKSIDDCEELVINTTATINNLSYYKVKNSIIQDRKLYIAECKVQSWVWVDARSFKVLTLLTKHRIRGIYSFWLLVQVSKSLI